MPNALCSATPTLLFDVALTAWRLQLWRRSRLVGTSDRNYTNLSIVRTTSCQRTPNIIIISSTKIIFGGPKSWPSAAIQTLWLDTSCFGTLCRRVSDGKSRRATEADSMWGIQSCCTLVYIFCARLSSDTLPNSR